jgi:hypothetical protein
LVVGFQYKFENPANQFITDWIIDTEHASQKLGPKVQNSYRHLANKRIKEISTSNVTNMVLKRQQYIIEQL